MSRDTTSRTDVRSVPVRHEPRRETIPVATPRARPTARIRYRVVISGGRRLRVREAA